MIGEISGPDRVFVRADLRIAGVRRGVGFGDIGADAIEDFDLLELRDAGAGRPQGGSARCCPGPGSGSSST